jgi:hypothetical protein
MPCGRSAKRFAALAPKLTTEQARQAVAPVLAAIPRTTATDSFALEALGQGLAALAPKLTAEQAWEAVGAVLAAIHGTTLPYALGTLGIHASGHFSTRFSRRIAASIESWVSKAVKDGLIDILCSPHEPRHAILLREAGHDTLAMLGHPPDQIARDADAKRAVAAAREQVDSVAEHAGRPED